jgi:hypothetical protein
VYWNTWESPPAVCSCIWWCEILNTTCRRLQVITCHVYLYRFLDGLCKVGPSSINYWDAIESSIKYLSAYQIFQVVWYRCDGLSNCDCCSVPSITADFCNVNSVTTSRIKCGLVGVIRHSFHGKHTGAGNNSSSYHETAVDNTPSSRLDIHFFIGQRYHIKYCAHFELWALMRRRAMNFSAIDNRKCCYFCSWYQQSDIYSNRLKAYSFIVQSIRLIDAMAIGLNDLYEGTGSCI